MKLTRMTCAAAVAAALVLTGCQDEDKGQVVTDSAAPAPTPPAAPTPPSPSPTPSNTTAEKLADPAVALEAQWEGTFTPILHKKGTGPSAFEVDLSKARGATALKVAITCDSGAAFKVNTGLAFWGTCDPTGLTSADIPIKQAKGKVAVTVPMGTKFWIVVVPKES